MPRPLHLSVLDQSPVPDGVSAAQALRNSLLLAQHVDALGYTRLWYSEHHAMQLLACSAPEILIARAASATARIRVGSGGIMLPHYSALKVAEVFRTLHAMFPGRIDLGVGRAPGGGRLEAYALRRSRNAPPVDDFPQQLSELRAFLNPGSFPDEHPFDAITVSPAPDPVDAPGSPDLWLLGSSMWSAVTAAREGLPYAFAHFFSPVETRSAMEYYRANFVPSENRERPQATIAVGVICAETDGEAERLHASVRLLQRRIRMDDRRPVATPEDAVRELAGGRAVHAEESEWPRYFVGTPDKVAARLRSLADELALDELLINTITHAHTARLRSYALLAAEMKLGKAEETAAA